MKKLNVLNLGKSLKREEMKTIKGGLVMADTKCSNCTDKEYCCNQQCISTPCNVRDC